METESRLKKKLFNQVSVQDTWHNAFVIVIPGFSENEKDIGNDMPNIPSDILGILNRKN